MGVLCCAAGIPELVAKLQSQGKNVFLVSGGFRQVIHPIAESLNIPVGNVFANNLLFKVRAAPATMACVNATIAEKQPQKWGLGGGGGGRQILCSGGGGLCQWLDRGMVRAASSPGQGGCELC